MDLFNDINIYLPQYLSSTGKDDLKKELAKFPFNGTKDTIYTSALNGETYLLQGDGIANVPYINFPNLEKKDIPVILLSNTCDMSLDNNEKRMNPCRILYAPLINYEKYKEFLFSKFKNREDRIVNHLRDVEAQNISQILYLPKGAGLSYDALVFFDRAISVPLNEKQVEAMCENKLFTLSNFGFYLLLLKISIHFTRIQEKIDRNLGIDLGKTKTI